MSKTYTGHGRAMLSGPKLAPQGRGLKIGVSGASGHLGTTALACLKVQIGDHWVVGISRSARTVLGADEVRSGDYDDPTTLLRAYAGLDRLLIIPTLDIRHGARARQLRAAIDAASAAGVGHVVLISDVGTREEPEPCVGAASWIGEQHLIRSAPRWTILRASYFMESFAQEVMLWHSIKRLPDLGESRVGFVSRDDVAAAAAGILLGEGHVGAIYNATGPAALTLAERADLVTCVLGAPLEVIQTSPTDLRRDICRAGFPKEYIDVAMDTKIKTVAGGFDIVTGDVSHLTGRPPKSLEEVLRHALGPVSDAPANR